MMNTKYNHSKCDMNVEAKSLSSGSCGKFIEVVIMLILIGSYYYFIHGYYCSTIVNTASVFLLLLNHFNAALHCYYCLILMVDSITFGHEMVNILVSGEEYDKVFNHLDMLNAPLEGKVVGIESIEPDEMGELNASAMEVEGLMSQVSTSIPADVVHSKASDLSTIDGDTSEFAGSLNIQVGASKLVVRVILLVRISKGKGNFRMMFAVYVRKDANVANVVEE
ncbi:hypothetical protein Tco_1222226 [Tanacetum coccineum]